MESAWDVVWYTRDHVTLLLGALAVAGVLYLVLNHKPKSTREADDAIDQMCHDGAEKYKKGRPLT